MYSTSLSAKRILSILTIVYNDSIIDNNHFIIRCVKRLNSFNKIIDFSSFLSMKKNLTSVKKNDLVSDGSNDNNIDHKSGFKNTSELKKELVLLMNFVNELIDGKNNKWNHQKVLEYIVEPVFGLIGYSNNIYSKYFRPSEKAGFSNSESEDLVFVVNDEICIYIEVKGFFTKLEKPEINQLRKYYNSSRSSQLGIITNGIKFLFYADFETECMMDDDYFYEIDLLNQDELGLHLLNLLSYSSIQQKTFNEIMVEIKELFQDIFEKNKIKKQLYSLMSKPWYSNDHKGRPVLSVGILMDYLQKTHPVITNESGSYIYKDGFYQKTYKDHVFKNIVKDHLITEFLKNKQIHEVVDLWKLDSYRYSFDLNNSDHDKFINFSNGMFDLEQKKLIIHSPKYKSMIQLNVEYKKEATCYNFLSFISKTLTKENLYLFQEILGYLLSSYTKAQKAFILFGLPRTGKSTIVKIIEDIIGERNISHIPWHDLHDKFKTSQLYGKLINTFSDISNKSFEDLSIFKALVGEDQITAEYKFGDFFTFTNKAKFVFSTNELPKNTLDKSDGFFRRLIIVPFYNQINEKEVDPNLVEKLLLEKEGIVQWALVGLQRLKENDFRFSETASNKELIAEYKEESNSILWFIENHCIFDSTEKIQAGVLYGTYKNICEENKLPIQNHIQFSKFLQENYKGKLVRKIESGTKRTFYVGIKLVSNE